MTLLRAAIESFAAKAPNATRPPAPMGALGVGLGRGFGGGGEAALSGYLRAMDNAGWLFAVVDAIASAISASEWRLYRTRSDGERVAVENHSLLDLWRSVNPFFTREEFLEVTSQHFDLTGEAWWIVVRQGLRPVELWPVRPDRMTVVASRSHYVEGYVYTIGTERIPLEPADVILIRRPHPFNAYRGIGPVQAISMDLQTEKAAAQWTRQFFANSAQPGGVVTFPNTVDDEEFERFVQRWRLTHQGVSNAGRVAVLESGATWTDVKVTQRDMQLEQLRRLNRDIILGAFRVHPSLVGISESVNRANAEAAEVTFARWVVRPRLVRLRAALNERLTPLFGEGLVFDFVDPTPENREQNSREAVEGYAAGVLTRNEARERYGEGRVEEGGDEFVGPAVMFSEDTPREPVTDIVAKQMPERLLSPELARAQERMLARWAHRLAQEREGLLRALERQNRSVSKLAADDVEAHDWDWWHKYGEDVVEELSSSFTIAFSQAYPGLGPTAAQSLAVAYAEQRAGDLLTVDGPMNMAEATRLRVRDLTARTIREGRGLGELSKALREDFAFSRSRADMVARTETATSLGQGHKAAAIQQGQDQKRWVTQGDGLVTDECRVNEAAGWLPIVGVFPSGGDTIPQHPRCRCTVIFRTQALAEVPHRASVGNQPIRAEFRCSGCNKLLGKDVPPGGRIRCGRCRREREAPGLTAVIGQG